MLAELPVGLDHLGYVAALRETLKFKNPISSAISTLWSALATSASALGRSQKRFSTEPELTPIRMARPCILALPL